MAADMPLADELAALCARMSGVLLSQEKTQPLLPCSRGKRVSLGECDGSAEPEHQTTPGVWTN